MPFRRTLQRGSFLFTNGSRFCFYTLLIPALLYSQSDSTASIVVTAATTYFDVFKQTAENSGTTILARESDAGVSARFGKDSMTLNVSSSEEYAGFSEPSSQFSASVHNSLQTLSCSYSRTLSLMSYSMAAGMVMNGRSHLVFYKGVLSSSPFEEVLGVTLALERSPYRLGSSISFYDFQVLSNDAAFWTIGSFVLRSRPVESLLASLAYREADGGSISSSTGYGTGSSDRYFGKNISIQYFFSRTSNISAELSTEELRSDIDFNRDGLLFGDLAQGVVRHSRYAAGGGLRQFDLPITLEYSFDEISSSGSGHIESWPFTDLVSSIISNRLLYQFNGSLKVHSFFSTAKLTVLTLPTNFEISYHRILADVVLENWEPEFLAFGMKNYSSNPFSIQEVQLLKIGIETSFLASLGEITAHVEQYIPLAITYRQQNLTPPVPGEPPASGPSPHTDGGRKISVRLKIPL